MNTTWVCQDGYRIFQEPGIDKVVLLVSYGLVSVMIVVCSVILMTRLWKQERTRVNIMFLVLSMSDTMVGGTSMPCIMLTSFIGLGRYCEAVSPITQFFIFFPASFTNMLTCVMSVDRYLAITRPHLHIKHLPRRTLYFCILIPLCLAVFHGFWRLLNTRTKTKPVSEDIRFITQMIIMFGTMLITSIFNIYLYKFVRCQSKIMKYNSHTSKSYRTRLTKTIIYMFLCLVCCTMVPMLEMLVKKIIRINNIIVLRNMDYWTFLVLWSNSFLNSIIVLRRSTNMRNVGKRNNSNASNKIIKIWTETKYINKMKILTPMQIIYNKHASTDLQL